MGTFLDKVAGDTYSSSRNTYKHENDGQAIQHLNSTCGLF